MAEWMKEIARNGMDAEVGGPVGEWLDGVRRAKEGPDGIAAAVSPRADRAQAGLLGASDRLLGMIGGYPDPRTKLPCDYSGKACGLRDERDILAWEAARHQVLVEPLTEGLTIPLPDHGGTDIRVAMPGGGPADHTDDGENLCDMIYTYASDADDPVRTIIGLGYPAYIRIYRYATRMHNKDRYGMNRRRVITLAERCADGGPDMVSKLLDILEAADDGEWDDTITIDPALLNDLATMPESFVLEGRRAAADMPTDGEYRDMLEDAVARIRGGYDTGDGRMYDIQCLERDLAPLNVRRRRDALRVMGRIVESYGMIAGMFHDDPQGHAEFFGCTNEPVGQAMKRIGLILDHGQDGMLRWAVLSNVSMVAGLRRTDTPKEYGGYINDGTIPERLVRRSIANGTAIVPVSGELRRLMEEMPTTMEGFRELMGPYAGRGTHSVRSMVLKAAARHGARRGGGNGWCGFGGA